tara:strand:- start:70 stop:537 length:468 start_codon:yes stop_codon:yes gene_type:complete
MKYLIILPLALFAVSCSNEFDRANMIPQSKDVEPYGESFVVKGRRMGASFATMIVSGEGMPVGYGFDHGNERKVRLTFSEDAMDQYNRMQLCERDLSEVNDNDKFIKLEIRRAKSLEEDDFGVDNKMAMWVEKMIFTGPVEMVDRVKQECVLEFE